MAGTNSFLVFLIIFIHVVVLCLCETQVQNSGKHFYAGDPTKPGTPANYQLSTKSRTVRLNWDAPPEIPGQMIQYEIVKKQDNKRVITKLTTHLYIGLDPWTDYTFTLRAFISDGAGKQSYSDPVSLDVKTLMDVPSYPDRLTLGSPNSTTLVANWDKPESANGNLEGYTLRWTATGTDVNVNVSSTSYTITGLQVYTEYTVSVAAYNWDGETYYESQSNNQTRRTEPGYPGPPASITVDKVSVKSARILWTRPTVANGPVSGYEVKWTHDGLVDGCIQTHNTEYILKDLLPESDYIVNVWAYNMGNQRYNGEAIIANVTTGTDDIGAVRDLEVKAAQHSLRVRWTPPMSDNIVNITGYVLSLDGSDQTRTTETSHTWSNLKSWTEYNISVTAFGTKEASLSTVHYGPPRFRTEWTLSGVPQVLGKIEEKGKSQTTIVFKTPAKLFSDSNGTITEYVLLVAESDSMGDTPESGLGFSNEAKFEKWDKAQETKTMYRSSPKGWMIDKENDICRAEKDQLVCIVGKQSKCDIIEYCNGPLQKKTTYRIKIRGYTNGGFSDTNVLQIQTSASTVLAPVSSFIVILLMVCLGQKSD